MPPLTDEEQDDLLLSCRYGDLDDVQTFVRRHGESALAGVRDENQNSILHMVCANGHLDLLIYLLPLLPLSFLSVQNISGSTPLHWAALNKHLEVVKMLVQFPGPSGVDLIDIKDAAGRSPLAEAEFGGWDEGAKWLVEVMNLEPENGKKGDDSAAEDDDIGVDASQDIEVEIEDAEGQIAKMKISGSNSTSML